ncbi:1,4-alpha-glucan branching protein [Nocardia halotolerans]|uniref:1,4-alpha-glucan branching protein n=1 Tax=Nocardia halotolerans TaxID=1755878 RepID=A0ABV8VC34_9NOCA
MAVIHHTSLTPSKLELVEAWLPSRQWYRGSAPRLSRAGGFRLDDADGAVGIEFMLLIDDSALGPVLYHVPLTYRDAPLPGADSALLGTAEHGVLGQRWVYDGTRDPVAVAAVADLLAGKVAAQSQSHSDTDDSTVVVNHTDLQFSNTAPGATVDGDTCTDHTELSPAVILRFHRLPVGPLPDVRGSVAAPYVINGLERSIVELVSVVSR